MLDDEKERTKLLMLLTDVRRRIRDEVGLDSTTQDLHALRLWAKQKLTQKHDDQEEIPF